MSQQAIENGWLLYGEPVRSRSCGNCRLCCTLVPTELPDGMKPSGVRCKHLGSKGCTIYARRPDPCRWWSCKWLFDPDTKELRRPDHSGYIIDPMLDTILAGDNPVSCVQVWVDPTRREAHRDPALRRYLQRVSDEHGAVAIIRWSSSEGFVLVPPNRSDTGDWLELSGNMISAAAIQAKLAALS